MFLNTLAIWIQIKKMMTHARCRIIKFASNVASARKSMIDINEFRYFRIY